MASEPPFILSRAHVEDLDRILDLQYDCFPPHLCVIFMGCHSKADLPKLRDKYVQQMRGRYASRHWCLIHRPKKGRPDTAEMIDSDADGKANVKADDPSDIWVKIEDGSTGDLIAASNWKVHINGAPKGESPDQVPEGLEGDVLRESQGIISLFNTKRAECMPGPFIHLHICFTSPAYRRRGAGGMMMKWGCELADLMGLPGWIEASEEGNLLYKTFGFYDLEKFFLDGEARGTGMKRDPKAVALKGGK